jgi:hypothetical protein
VNQKKPSPASADIPPIGSSYLAFRIMMVSCEAPNIRSGLAHTPA